MRKLMTEAKLIFSSQLFKILSIIKHFFDFKLIELRDEDVFNLDDVLPKMLLKFGVQTY